MTDETIEVRDIILSIKPVYWERIVGGEKKYEYRRKIVIVPEIRRIYFYVTAPVKKVMGYAEVVGNAIALTPEDLWDATEEGSRGIEKEAFLAYFDGIDENFYGHPIGAYQLGAVTVFPEPKDVSEFGLKRAPQSFAYVKEYAK